MSASFGLGERVVMVTGGASGIGLSVVRLLVAEGAAVAIADSDIRAAEAEAQKLSDSGARVAAYALDVRDASATRRAVDAIEAELGPIEGLVAAAGVSRPMAAVDMDKATWDLVLDINLKGTFFSCQAVGRHMVERGRGAIVTIASTSSLGGHAGRVHYCASKAGVVGVMRDLAIEWGTHGVRVNAVGPSATDTPMIRDGIPEDFVRDVFEDRTPLGRLCQPEEIGNVCLFLLSDLASYVTGSLVMADGGMTAGWATRKRGRDMGSKALLAQGRYEEAGPLR